MGTYPIEQRELPEQTTAVVRSVLGAAEIGPFVGRAIGLVASVLAARKMFPTGPPFARYRHLGDHSFAVEAGLPTAAKLLPTDQVSASSLPGGPAAVLTYIGPYDEMEPAYDALTKWVERHGGEPSGDPWEVYFSDPETEPDPRTWRTEIVMPLHR